jgi:hypothetical protein
VELRYGRCGADERSGILSHEAELYDNKKPTILPALIGQHAQF